MRITTSLIVDIESGTVLNREWYDYHGPLELCDRALQSQATNAATTAGGSAATAGSTAGGIGANLIPYETQQMLHPTGFSQRDIGARLTSAMAGTGGATAGLTGAAGKMGTTTRNPMGFSSALDSVARSRAKGVAGESADTAAENAKVKLGQQSDAAKGLSGLYGTNLEAQSKFDTNQTDDINSAVKAGDSGWLQNMNQTIAALGQGASGATALIGACPAQGSLYLTPDGERKVEDLVVGGLLTGIDGESQTIEEIQSGWAPVLRVTTEDGHTVRNSRVHAYALPYGGFVVATKSLNKAIKTGDGDSKVISVQPDGIDIIFNVITDGSHTYRADGVWALGVGEAERYTSMEEWATIVSNMELVGN